MWCNAMLRNENLCFRCAPGHFRQSCPKWTSPRVTFVKATRNGPRPGSLSPKQPEMDLAPGHFRQSSPKWTSPRVTFAKVARNGPRPGSLLPKLSEMDLAPDHFCQSCPKWTSPRVTLAKAVRNGPQKAFVIPRSLHSAGRSGKIQLSPQPAPLPFRWAKDYCLSRCA